MKINQTASQQRRYSHITQVTLFYRVFLSNHSTYLFWRSLILVASLLKVTYIKNHVNKKTLEPLS